MAFGALALIVTLGVCPARAQETNDLTALTLDEFFNVEVSSVRKSRQKLSRTPAAVYAITGEDIRRSGLTTLAEILRLAPGVHVARVGASSWAVGIRGFNGMYSNKLLVMIDGRPIYNPLLSGTIWNSHLAMIDDIERIEVIRGPGGTMWGANAVSGVINIITRRPGETAGGLVAASGGSFERASVRARYGGAGRNTAWRAWGVSMHSGATLPARGEEPTDGTWLGQSGGLVWEKQGLRDAVSIEAETSYANGRQVMDGIGPNLQPEPWRRTVHTLTSSVQTRWTHVTRRGGEMALRVSGDRTALDAGSFDARVGTIDADFQHHQQFGSHDLVAGGGFRSNKLETAAGTRLFDFDPRRARYRILNAFVADEWELARDRLYATAGVKVEHFSRAGVEVQPEARLLWTPTRRTVVWGAVARAVRVPSHIDYALRYTIAAQGYAPPMRLAGNPEVAPETLKAFEVGFRRQWRRLALEATAFRNAYRGLESFRFDLADFLRPGVVEAVMENGYNGKTQGGELSLHYDPHPRWRLSGSYSGLFTRFDVAHPDPGHGTFYIPFDSPRHQAHVRSAFDIGRRWSLDLMVWRQSAQKGYGLPGFERVDARLARRVGEWTEVAFAGHNLTRARHVEAAPGFMYAGGAVPRSMQLELTRRF